MHAARLKGLTEVCEVAAAHSNGTGRIDTDGQFSEEFRAALADAANQDLDRPDRLGALDAELCAAADEAIAAGHCGPAFDPTTAAHAAGPCECGGRSCGDGILEPSPTALPGTVRDLWVAMDVAQQSHAATDPADYLAENIARRAAVQMTRAFGEACSVYPGVVRVSPWYGYEVTCGSASLRKVILEPEWTTMPAPDGRPIADATSLPWPSAVAPADDGTFGRVAVGGVSS